MSRDNPRRRIDWNGEGQQENATQLLKSRGRLRKAYVPAAIGFTALALIAALAAGPVMRGMAGAQTEPAAAAIDTALTETVEAAAIVQPASAEAPAPDAKPAATKPETNVFAAAATSATAITSATPAATAARASAEQPGSAGLEPNDPRWNPAALAVDEDKLTALKQAVDETVAAAEIATAMGNTEGLVTSGIPATAAGFAPERPSLPASERSAFDAALVATEDETVAEPAVASKLSPAKATQYVNMRAGPDDGATVLTVVPANASIQAEADCRWCEVSYNGKTGYIYRTFIARN